MLAAVTLSLVPLACSKKPEPAGAAAQASSTAAAAAKPAPQPPVTCEAGADGRCAPSPSCSPTCQQIATPECLKCEASGDCNIFADNCESPLLTPGERATCYEIVSCVQSTNCFDGPNATLGSCYCGKLPLKQCLAAPMVGPGAPDGVCHDIILKGMPNARVQSHVLGNLTTRVEHAAAGLALSRLNCQKIGFRKQCASVCGFGDITPEPLPAPRPRQ
jgi:hypothetical protein